MFEVGMNRNLNPDEFQLLDPNEYEVSLPQHAAEAQPSPREAYGGEDGAWSYTRWGRESFRDNPVYDDYVAGGVESSFNEQVGVHNAGVREEFLPTPNVVSSQVDLNHAAVEHQVAHATGLDVPNIHAIEGQGEFSGQYMVTDGNHRLNAALRRGQMFIPAEVTGDASRW